MVRGIALELLDHLRQCSAKSEAEDVDFDSYIKCWSNLKQVLDAMGSVFKFVSSDVEDKVNILLRIGAEKQYVSVEQMMSEEITNKLINYERLDEKNPSGSRTLLRLHRALKMVELILSNIALDGGGKMSTIAYEAYHGSPMPAHHPWVIRKAIGVAVYTLPDTTSFLNDIAPGIDAAERKIKLAEAGAIMKSLFDKTDNLYIKHKLESIP